jgi:Zn-dependent M28 family amino/carboxypeptidase
MFVNWDAEEYGLIGSTEFVEEFANTLMQRAVVYLNVDTISSNESLYEHIQAYRRIALVDFVVQLRQHNSNNVSSRDRGGEKHPESDGKRSEGRSNNNL